MADFIRAIDPNELTINAVIESAEPIIEVTVVGAGPAGRDGSPGVAGPAGPKGDRGETGPKGDSGPAGPAGPAGPKGDRGETGPKGDRGDPGPTGPTGPIGPAGPRGETGPKGDKGDRGLPGETGPQGDRGEPGPQGERGEQGARGATGATGPVGPMGPQGPKGDTGERGPKGDRGVQGETGPRGPQGLPGQDGLDGAPGKDGYTPVKGIDYFDGAPGKDGSDGAPGKDGYTPQKGVDYFDGAPGEKGDPFTYADFTPEQLEALRGPQGNPGSDANVTAENIESALGYVPASEETVDQLSQDKLDKPKNTPDVGNVLTVQSVSEAGTFQAQWSDAPKGIFVCEYGVTTFDEVAQAINDGLLPIVSFTIENTIRFGKLNSIYNNSLYSFTAMFDNQVDGCRISVTKDNKWSYMRVGLNGSAPERAITLRELTQYAITCANYDFAVKAAMCDGKGAAWTADEQAAARGRMGALGTSDIESEILPDKANAVNGKAVYEYILSRGENLFANGKGSYGNNYNMSQLIFDGSNAPNGCSGSFKTQSLGFVTDEKMPVDATKPIKISFKYFLPSQKSPMLLYVKMFDNLGNPITDAMTRYFSSSLKQVAADINNGDTEIYFDDLTGWASVGNGAGSDSGPFRIVQIWDYVDDYGKKWEPGTYTRHYVTALSNIYERNEEHPDGGVDYANNCLHLKGRWSGGFVPAGTWVSQCMGGGNLYVETTIGNNIEYNKWVDYSFTVQPNNLWPGTALISLGALKTANVGNDVYAYIADINVTQKDRITVVDKKESYFDVFIEGTKYRINATRL